MPPSQRTELPIPRELDELVLACLEKDPKRRPQNAEELLRMIDDAGQAGRGDPPPPRPGGKSTCWSSEPAPLVH